MNLDEALVTFTEEGFELLDEMEEVLLNLDAVSDPTENFNALFRVAHTIKGSAGIFKLKHISEFTHVVESLFDQLREKKLIVDDEIISLLLKCTDYLKSLVTLVENGILECTADLADVGDGLLHKLTVYEGVSRTQNDVSCKNIIGIGGNKREQYSWHISLRFGENALRDGLDPLSSINFLTTLGEIEDLIVLDDAIPGFDEFDPETFYLGYEINFLSSQDRETIESAFEFVRENSTIKIVPMGNKSAEYIERIEKLPEGEFRLGDILVECGVITPSELVEALKQQKVDSSKGSVVPLGEVLIMERMAEPSVVKAALDKQNQRRIQKLNESLSIRVNTENLNGHVNLIGELINASASVVLRATQMGDSKLDELTAIMDRLVEEVRDSALHLRMVQVGPTFNKFKRMVRDLSESLNKKIDIVFEGMETEVDKTIIEKISDPLMHLVRNSIDHGIEPPEVRLQQGKSECGTLYLNAKHDSGFIIIEISDDGAGLNRDHILNSAIKKGLADNNQKLTDQNIYDFIFKPGFSTTDVVTDISGRGVGMDVVKQNITDLSGTIALENNPGKGLRFQIRLPLTLAIIDGFRVSVDDNSYIIPLNLIHECLEMDEVKNGIDEGRDRMNLRGEILPFVRLRKLFSVSSEPPIRESVVVVNNGGSKIGVIVDHLLGEFLTVLKPLGVLFNRLHYVSGSAILNSGEVALVLNVPGLVQQVAILKK